MKVVPVFLRTDSGELMHSLPRTAPAPLACLHEEGEAAGVGVLRDTVLANWLQVDLLGVPGSFLASQIEG